VMVTSEKSMGKIEEALDQAGADEYITKPFTMDELTRKVNKVIRKVSATTAASPAAKPSGFFSKLLGGG
jgi:two-component system, chemotaxis family, chemotaxis protein CheY